MKIAKFISLAGLLAMTAVLIYGFTYGDFMAEGAVLLSMPWGIVSLVDLYVGFALFSCWIVFREKALLPSIIWVVLMMVLGFLGRLALYLPCLAEERRRLAPLLVRQTGLIACSWSNLTRAPALSGRCDFLFIELLENSYGSTS